MIEKIQTKRARKTKPTGLKEWRTAQTQREKQYNGKSSGRPKGINKWAQSIIEAKIQLAQTVQRAQFVKGEIDRLMTCPGPQEEKKVQALHDEASELKQKYWRLDKQAYILEECPFDILMKAYQALHSRYGWHLISYWLRNDCARRGGCCGRSCKYYSEKPPTQDRLNGWGHCTTECGCCNRVRGFALEKEDNKLFQPDFNIDRWGKSRYSLSIFMAYMWGLN